MNLEVEKDERNNGRYFHKSKGFNSTVAKSLAMKDISKECGDGKFYTKNYIGLEYKIMNYCKFYKPMIRIN